MSSHGTSHKSPVARRVFIILTGCLILAGLLVLIERELSAELRYDDIKAYQEGSRIGELPIAAPKLPICARDIVITRVFGGIEAIAFSCLDVDELDQFLEDVTEKGKFNISTLSEIRVLLTARD